jgi:5-oxoprolinase (ATP-hydrolysing) subunit A
MKMNIDLNCDMGEGFGIYHSGDDEALMGMVSSVNLACGFHASDPLLMRKMVRLARIKGVTVGAHPSYPDLVGFGRRLLHCSPDEVEADVIYQVGALAGFCRSEGIELNHVKAHGALYNQAACDIATARAVARAVRAFDDRLFLICQAGSEMVRAAREEGVRFVEEAFADRAYSPDGRLLSRMREGAVINDPEEIAERVVIMIEKQSVLSCDGTALPLSARTICVHGDTREAVRIIGEIRKKLDSRGICVRPFGLTSEYEKPDIPDIP